MKTFLRGLLAFLPAFLTIYAVLAFGNWLDRVTGDLLTSFVPGLPDVPGLGVVLGLVAILLLGIIVSSRFTSWLFTLLEIPLRRVPVISDLYTALKQMTSLVAPAEDSREGSVVRVQHPDQIWCVVGVQTRSDAAPAGYAPGSEELVAVYIPLSYQIGGYTVFVPRAWVCPLDMNVDAAMRGALTGWLADDKSPAAGART